MANHKSAIKRAKQNEIRRCRNKSVKSRVKNSVKELQILIKNNEKEDNIFRTLNDVKSVIDSAVKKGVIHRKTGSRKISRLAKAVNIYVLDK